MSMAGIQVVMTRANRERLALLGSAVVTVMVLGGCDSPGGTGASWVPADIGEQVVVFIQDFARQALAAWLF